MKHLLPIGLAVVLGVFGLVAQSYKSRQPYPSEIQKVAGLTDYVQEGPHFDCTISTVGEGQEFSLNATNFMLTLFNRGAVSNALVTLPNPTNSARKSYIINASGNVVVTLGCSVLTSFSTTTNGTVAASGGSELSLDTNCTVWVINNQRTNWLVMPIH